MLKPAECAPSTPGSSNSLPSYRRSQPMRAARAKRHRGRPLNSRSSGSWPVPPERYPRSPVPAAAPPFDRDFPSGPQIENHNARRNAAGQDPFDRETAIALRQAGHRSRRPQPCTETGNARREPPLPTKIRRFVLAKAQRTILQPGRTVPVRVLAQRQQEWRQHPIRHRHRR